MLGWFGGGNRRRFTELAAASDFPMGVLAVADDAPVGWCAFGPRSRYMPAVGGRSQLLRTRPRDEDDSVWLIACLYVDARQRGHGTAHALVGAAENVAHPEDATAVEGWPTASPAPSTADLFVGRAQLFLAQGFRRIDRPSPQRRIMRLDLRPGRPSTEHREPNGVRPTQLEVLGLGDQLGDPALQIVEGVHQGCELRYGVFVPLVGRLPVVHRPRHYRCRFDRHLARGSDRDELVDVEHPVVGQAGVRLPGQPGGGMRAQRLDGIGR